MHVWDYSVDDDLNKLIYITYTNKMNLFFGSFSLKNFTIKCVWLGTITR